MAIPNQNDISSLEYTSWSMPLFCTDSSSGSISGTLENPLWSMPFVVIPNSTGQDFSNVYVKVSGNWKLADSLYINVSGTWKSVEGNKIYYNQSGTWYTG